MYTCIPYGLIGKILSSLKYCLWLAICQISIYMIGFPGDSIQRNLPQKLYHILTPIVMRLSLLILTHKDNRHIGEIGPNSLPKSSGPHCILRHLWFDHHNGKGHPLLNNHRTMYNHRLTCHSKYGQIYPYRDIESFRKLFLLLHSVCFCDYK